MTLTVPTAGSTAGRSADIRVAPSAVPDAVTGLARQMTQVGIALEDDRLQRQLNRAQVDLTRDVNNLQLELREIGDPDQLDATFNARRDALLQAYTRAPGENGQPRIDPRNAEQFQLMFDQMTNQAGFQVGARALELRQSQRQATWLDYRHEVINSAAVADPETRQMLIDMADEQIAQRVNAGIISPAEGAAERQALAAEAANAAARRHLADDPEGLQAAIAAGTYAALPAEALAGYETQAQAEIDRRATRSAEDAAQAQRQAEAALDDQIDEYIAIAGASDQPIDMGFVTRPDVQARPNAARLNAALELRTQVPDLRRLPPARLQELIAAEQARPVTARWQTERLQILRETLAATNQGLSTDPIAWAADVGFSVEALPPFDPSDPAALAAGLSSRRGVAQGLIAQGYMRDQRVLMANDRTALVAGADAMRPPAERAALAAVLAENLPRMGPDSLEALVPDRVFQHMGALVATGTPAALAEEVFRGQQAILAGNVALPDARTRLTATGGTLAAMFGDIEGGEAEQARVREATDALYAARVRRTDPGNAEDFNEDLYLQALHEVMGGSGAHDSTAALGGWREVNGYPTLLPRGMSAALAENVLATVGYSENRWAPDTMLAQLTAASIGGAPPAYSDPNAFWDDLQGAQLRAVGDDQYVIIWPTASGPRSIPDVNGREFRISLRRLVQQVPQ